MKIIESKQPEEKTVWKPGMIATLKSRAPRSLFLIVETTPTSCTYFHLATNWLNRVGESAEKQFAEYVPYTGSLTIEPEV